MEILTINDILRNIVINIYEKTNYNILITSTYLKDLLKNQNYYFINDNPFYIGIIKDYKYYFINLIYSDVLEYLVSENNLNNKVLLNTTYNMIINNMANTFPYNNELTNKLLYFFTIVTINKEKKKKIRKNTLNNQKILNLVKNTNPLYMFED